MLIALLLQLAVLDPYPTIPLSALATTRRNHVCVIGPVVYVRKQEDGDVHVTVDDGRTRVVLEIMPHLPLPAPKKGLVIKACGLTRFDKGHQWPELHPLTSWRRYP